MIKTAVGFFLVIFAGSLLSALAGGLFAWSIAAISPRFVAGLFGLTVEDGGVGNYAFSVGMIWGLFIGAGVAGFSCGLSVVMKLIRLRIDLTRKEGA